MQKKIIALAIAAVVSAPAFADNANISFYGTADVSNDFVTTGNGTAAANSALAAVAGTAKRNISSNVSKFGFKGAEDLGDGLHAIWQIEQQINFDNSYNTTYVDSTVALKGTNLPASGNTPAGQVVSSNNGLFATRNTFAGLKNESFGTVMMGRIDTPFKTSSRKLDVFADSIADNRALIGNKSGGGGFDQRLTDVLAYVSPAFAGVTVAVATVNLSESNTLGATAANSAFSAAAMYDVAPFYGSLAYESHTLSDKATATILTPVESAARVGFGFKADGLELNVVYESTTDNLGTANGNKFGHTGYYVGGKYAIGAGAVKLAYGQAGAYGDVAAGGIANSSASQISIGYDQGLSKRTTLYAIYSQITNGTGANYGFSQGSAALASPTATNPTVNGSGGTPTVISLGLKHSF